MLLNCNRGCKFSDGTTDGSLDIENNEVICNKCGDIISGISDFVKISMKNIKDIKRVNKKKAFVFPCKTCHKSVETEVLTGKVKGKGCNNGNCQINISDFMVKIIEEVNFVGVYSSDNSDVKDIQKKVGLTPMAKLTESQLLSIKKVSFIYLAVITVSIALARTPFFKTNYNSSSKQEVAVDSNSNNDDLEKAEFLRLLSAEGDISTKEEGNTDEVKPKEKVGRVDSSGETQNKKKRPEALARVDNTSTRRSEQVEESSSKIPINNHELNESYMDLAEEDPKTFLYYHSNEPWAQPYIDSAAKNLAEKNPKYFLENYLKEPWARPYIDLAAKKFAKKDPKTFLYYHSEKPWAQPYVDLAVKILEEELSD